MEITGGILAFSTSNYDAMRLFFSAIGMEVVEDPLDSLVPIFGSGRGAFVSRGDVSFNLEEVASHEACARFNLMLMGYSELEIQKLPGVGYYHSVGESIYGRFHHFTSPDGGKVTITT